MKFIISRLLKVWLIRIYLISIVLFTLMNLKSQNLEHNKENNISTIYFINIDHKSIIIDHYNNDRYIGKLEGKKYLKYECTPGEQLFWIVWNKKLFLTADLKPGGIYVVIEETDSRRYKFYANLNINLVNEKDEKSLSKAKKYIKKGERMENSEKEIDDMNKKISKFIENTLQQYEQEWKNKYEYNHISPDMAIPPEALK